MSRIYLICILVCGMFTLLPAEPLERYVAVDNVCAWPNLTLLKDGTLTATIFNQPHHGKGAGDVESWVSTDGGRMWELGGVAAPRAPGSNRMNVAAGAAHDGSVVVLASGWGGAGFRERILPSLVCRSSDGGRTWEQSSGVTLPDGVQNLIPFGDIVQAPGNILVAPGYSWRLPHVPPAGSTAYVIFSRDDGRTWTENAVIAEDDYNETALIRLRSGRWLAAIRTHRDGHLELFGSEDEARSWASWRNADAVASPPGSSGAAPRRTRDPDLRDPGGRPQGSRLPCQLRRRQDLGGPRASDPSGGNRRRRLSRYGPVGG